MFKEDFSDLSLLVMVLDFTAWFSSGLDSFVPVLLINLDSCSLLGEGECQISRFRIYTSGIVGSVASFHCMVRDSPRVRSLFLLSCSTYLLG